MGCGGVGVVFVEMDSWGDISCVRWPTRLKETERGKQASDGWKIPVGRRHWSAKAGGVSKPHKTPSLSNTEHLPGESLFSLERPG